jgi:hypothetical protein
MSVQAAYAALRKAQERVETAQHGRDEARGQLDVELRAAGWQRAAVAGAGQELYEDGVRTLALASVLAAEGVAR